MQLELHDYRRCPFCIRVRILLHLKQIPYSRIHEPLREWTDWMLKNVDKPRVPVLHVVNDNGTEQIMSESNEINLWLDANFGEITYTPEADSEAYKEMIQWWEWCTSDLKPMIDLYKYGDNRNFDVEEHKIHIRELSGRVQKIEDHLQTQKYLIDERLTLADIAIIPFIRQIMRTRNGEFDFTNYPQVTSWSSEILESDWFNDIVMKK